MSHKNQPFIKLGDHSQGNYIAARDLQINQLPQQQQNEDGNKDRATHPLRKILFLSANPKTTARLRLDEEARKIEEGLLRSKYRQKFEIRTKWAVNLWDLRRSLLDNEPHIVHFTGHGTEKGVMVEDELGLGVAISADALSGLFALCSDQVECVVLSACHSGPQATAVSKHIGYVIGMKNTIQDKAAIEFAVGFYDALGAGKPVPKAFKFGINAIQQKFPDIPDDLFPLLIQGGVL
jgi:hypothetical protein